MSSDPCVTILPAEQVLGLSFTALAGFISAFAVTFVLILVARNYIRNLRNPPPGEWKLIRTHVDAYLLSLLASDFMQSLGAILDIKWAAEQRVYCSTTCTAQGVIQVIGETGVAMATFAITLHTFLVIFFRWSPSHHSSWIWKVGISFIWLYVTLYGIIGYATHHRDTDATTTIDAFYTPTPYWCWISNNFLAERITAEYFWLWFAAFSSIILYTFLFFRVRGNITVDPHDWRRVSFKRRRWRDGDDGGGDGYFDGSGNTARGGEAGKIAAREAMSMIWYPVTYTGLVLPLSIVRWSTFRPIGQTEGNVPFALTSVVVTIFGLSGIVNVILMLLTRKNLLLFGQRGVIHPARIGPAAAGRIPRRGRNDGGGGGAGGGGGGAGVGVGEKKGKFNFRHFVGASAGQKHGSRAGAKREMAEDSTEDTSDDRRRTHGGGGQGETSFAADRFTTQAFETERSFDVGSNRAPFSPVSAGPTDTNQTWTGNTDSGLPGIPLGEEQSYGFGFGYGPGLESANSGIPEGMSRDLGGRAEYDVDVEREREGEREWRSLGSVQPSSSDDAGGMGKAGVSRGKQTLSSGLETQPGVSQPSDFLELKDSRSIPGLPEAGYPHYPPHPPPLPPPQTPPPPSPHPYAQPQPPQPQPRPLPQASAGTSKNVGGGSRPSSAKSKAGSSLHPGRTSVDMADYSVPMKFNPTPAPTPPSTIPPPDTPDSRSRSPYFATKSRNGSSKSLGKATSTSTATTRSPWSGFTSMFSKRDSYGVSSPNSAQSDDASLPLPPAPPLPQHPHQHQHQHEQQASSGSGRHPSYHIPNHPYQQASQQDMAPLRPPHFPRDFGPQPRSSPSAELERSPFDDAARLEKPRPHEDLALVRTRTGNSSRDSVGVVAGGGGGTNLQTGSWSRTSAGGRIGTQSPLADDEAHHFRPNTAGSNRSYTLGLPGFHTVTTAVSSSSLRADATAAHPEHGLEMQERTGRVSTHPTHSSVTAQAIETPFS